VSCVAFLSLDRADPSVLEEQPLQAVAPLIRVLEGELEVLVIVLRKVQEDGARLEHSK
jgi:hypothetical protein